MFNVVRELFKDAAFGFIALLGKSLPSAKKKSALICPPAPWPGGMGDDALISSLVGRLMDNQFTPIDVIEQPKSNAWKETLHLDGSVNYPASSLLGWLKFQWASKEYSHVFVVGADMIDGHYNVGTSKRMLKIADIAARSGKSSTITGCSFNTSAHPLIIKTINQLDKHVRLLARDPRSYSRLKKLTTHDVELVADLAFMLKPDGEKVPETLDWISSQHNSDCIVLGVNLAPIVLGTRDKEVIDKCVNTFYKALSEQLEKNNNLAVLLMPHDVRSEIGDIDMCERLYTELFDKYNLRVYIFNEDYKAGSIKAVASKLDACITCRMHLAIACLGSGVPVGAVTYQDKFEGLFDHFKVAPPLIAGEDATNIEAVTRLINDILSKTAAMRVLIENNIKDVVNLSEMNIPK